MRTITHFVSFISLFVLIFIYISKAIHNDISGQNRVYGLGPKIVKNGNADQIFWFVQVTDIHISRYYGFKRAPDLQDFCDTHLTVIKPDFVLATGDLTDAKFKDLRGSKQFLDEWKTYQNIVQHCQKTVTTWLDLRGNHDSFGTPSHGHEDNLFRLFSAQGGEHPSSYVYHHKKPYGTYSFVAVDATPNPGPKRPFNFFGYIQQSGEATLNQILNGSRTSNLTIAFGHYPTSLITMESGMDIRYLLRNVTGYLCGHLHTLGGLVRRMFARHKTGMLELELGDWKDERIYRVLAVDNDMLSIQDSVMNQWPVVLVTNPKEASMQTPLHEPYYAVNKSSHIRMLVFTTGTITSIDVFIDGVYLGQATSITGPVYVLPWTPSDYKWGLHTLRIEVKDDVYGLHIKEHVFSLDGTSPLFQFRARLILMMDLGSLLQAVFYLLIALYVGLLVSLHRCSNIKPYMMSGQTGVTGCVARVLNSWLYRAWLLAHVGRLFYPLVGFTLYVAFGPWFAGEILDGHTGVVFVWGMYVCGTYLPACLLYLYGIFQMLTFNIPLSVFLGYYMQYYQTWETRKSTIFHRFCHIHSVPFPGLILFQSYVVFDEFPAAYGTSAVLLGPVRTGSVILALIFYNIGSKQM
ncbi:LOW QUALITY PROTEIN: transmembrane protein 62-like [Dreissena polymorpha]|uniref:LOW QUALITY PROTEIN: transmembrane protein 62-like n=1 Tax=Dreissena polymorpha TaxID=45954 RepID=UPI002264C9C6|nr:LOW QUALITY PROTEIN: transmembrane protein 62-like [Dreissena polymorpha]